jgi:capsular exopolysaccharide synthesis family protein
MELKYYLSVLWRWAWLLILAPLLAGTVSLFVSQRMQPVYRASATLLINPAGNSSSLNYSSLLTSELIAKTYAELLTKRPLLEKVISELQLNLTPHQLAGKINVVQPSDSQLLKLQVEDSNPQLAITIANSLATSFLRQHNRHRSGRSVYIEIVEPASLPAYKLRPRIFFNTVVAAFAGGILAIGFIFLLDYLDDSLTTPESVETTLGIPNLATIPSIKRHTFLKRKEIRLVTPLQSMSPFAEAYRGLRTNLQFAEVDQAVNTLLVTSALPKEGKTTTVANLGSMMAQAGLKVLLVDADLRAATLHQVFDVPNKHGLTDLLVADVVPDESYLLETTIPNLRLLPSGRFPADKFLLTPSELLGSVRMTELISQLSALTDVLLFDSPPVLAVTDAAVLASQVEGVLLVIASGRTSKKEGRMALQSLQKVRAKVLGTALTRCKERVGYYYYYYGSYGTGRLEEIIDSDIPLSTSFPASEQVRTSLLDADNRNGLEERRHG